MAIQKLILIIVPIAPLSLIDDLKNRLGSGYHVKYCPPDGSSKECEGVTEQDWKEVEGLLTFMMPPSIKSVKQTPKLKFIQLASAGYNHFTPSPFWQSVPEDNPLTVASASGIHVVPIAEHVIMTTLAVQHHLPPYILSQSHSIWDRDERRVTRVRELRGSTMGVLGYGHIGRECARMAKAMGMKVVVATRSGKKSGIGGYLVDGTGDHEGDIPSAWYSTEDKKSLAEFYSKCDVLVNSLPSASETQKFVDAAAFKAMPSDGVYVNIGRGDTVDQDALIHALSESTAEAERIGAASLDVTDPEPLPSDSKLWGMKNVLITPHVSGASDQYWVRAMDLMGVNVVRVLQEGKGALNAVRGKREDD